MFLLIMLANLASSNIHFGWNAVTHQALSLAATNSVNRKLCGRNANVVFNTQAVTLASPMPDKEQHAPYSHSADIDNRTSGDAFDVFNQYDAKIKEELKNGNSNNIEGLVGRALHYLQDMTDPAHTINSKNSALTKKDKDIHLQIETKAVCLQKSTIFQAKQESEDESINFGDFLANKMKESKNIYKELKEEFCKKKSLVDKDRIEALERKSLTNSYQVSFKYLKQIGLLKKSAS